MQKILVTGGAGFIGSHLAESLLEKGYSVVVIDNFNNYYNPKQKENNIQKALTNPNYKLVKGDILNKELIQELFQQEKFNAVVHLAAMAGIRNSIENPELYQKVNVEGTLNLLIAATKNNVKKFIFGSSSSIYGTNTKIPFEETDKADDQICPYASSKKAGESFCRAYHHLYGIQVACLRFFTVYGPRGRPDMAPFLFTDKVINNKEITIFGDGSSSRDYTYVKDIVQGIIKSIEIELTFEIFNIGNSSPTKLMEFINTIEIITNKKATLTHIEKRQGDMDVTYANISKAQSTLNYQPKTTLQEGMRKFIDWYNSNFPTNSN